VTEGSLFLTWRWTAARTSVVDAVGPSTGTVPLPPTAPPSIAYSPHQGSRLAPNLAGSVEQQEVRGDDSADAPVLVLARADKSISLCLSTHHMCRQRYAATLHF
jgi:hypothetical protein